MKLDDNDDFMIILLLVDLSVAAQAPFAPTSEPSTGLDEICPSNLPTSDSANQSLDSCPLIVPIVLIIVVLLCVRRPKS